MGALSREGRRAAFDGGVCLESDALDKILRENSSALDVSLFVDQTQRASF